MTVNACKVCGAPIPLQQGRGRRRTMCQTCSPSRDKAKRLENPVQVLSVGGALDAVTAELRAVNMLNSHQGQIALGLARRFDDGEDTGAAFAQVARQLRETMASALASAAPAAADPLDELRAKRERRGSA